MAYNEIKKKLIKKARVGWRLNITIGCVVILLLVLFESLTFKNLYKYEGNPFEFAKIHIFHAVITLIVLLIANFLLISRYVVKPIYKLLIAIDEMKDGKLVTSLDIKSNDEFQLLAEEFNEMGFKLREHLQQKVRSEKYSSALAVANRVVNRLKEPFSSLMSNVKLLRDVGGRDNPQVANLSDLILKDLQKIEKNLDELGSFTIPEELTEKNP